MTQETQERPEPTTDASPIERLNDVPGDTNAGTPDKTEKKAPEKTPELAQDRTSVDARQDSARNETRADDPHTDRTQEIAGEWKAEMAPDEPKFTTCTAASPMDTYRVRQWVFSDKNYIQYIPGDAPLILVASHGGDLQARQDFPEVIYPSRDANREIRKDKNGNPIPSRDGNSLEKTMEVAQEFYRLTGLTPHIIINRVVRGRLQLNSDKDNATRGPNNSKPENKIGEKAWQAFHDYIRAAKRWVTTHCQRGLILDMHTNGRTDLRNEFGYITTNETLKQSASAIEPKASLSSVKHLAGLPWSKGFVDVMRGNMSLGELMGKAGYKSIPSAKHPFSPDKYYTGGYNIREHGSHKGGSIDAIQLETSFDFINNAKRSGYSKTLASALKTFIAHHYRLSFPKRGSTPLHSTCANAQIVKLNGGKSVVFGTTWGANNEFGDKITCGQSTTMQGPQLYYNIRLEQGKQYEFTYTGDFYARLYLFQGACDAASISASCKQTGINGTPYAFHNEPFTKRFSPPKTGDFILAVDSRKASWFGTFRLDIKEVKP